MNYLIIIKYLNRHLVATVTLLTGLLCAVLPVHAQTVDDVIIKTTKTGYELEIRFFFPMRIQSYSPKNSGKVLEIRLRPELILGSDEVDQAGERSNLSWNKDKGASLNELIFEGEDPDRPSVIARFNRNINFKVRSSADLRSIIIAVEDESETITNKSPEAGAAVVRAENLITRIKGAEPKVAALLDEANNAMLDKNYSRAVQLFTKIREIGSEEVRRHAQELLGVAREYNRQLAHAKAEYEKYLQDYPGSADADRVNQRLIALITAPEKPKEKLRVTKGRGAGKDPVWNTEFYGSLAQRYFRDETSPENQETLITRSDVTNDLDFVARARSVGADVRAQFIGSYREDLRSESDGSETIISIMSVEAKHLATGLYGRVGRQSRTTGGVLGRFDGLHLAYDINDFLTFNAVYGYPVKTTDKTKINSDQEFFGVSVDLGSLWTGWDFNLFYITQDNFNLLDREAVGGEARYYDATKSFFTLVDYDVSYNDLNIFLFIGNWQIFDNTSINLVVDKRNSPVLATTNSIQGQGVEELDELFERYTDRELEQLAVDRTSDSESVTLGITYGLNDRWQITGEATQTDFGATRASGGVEEIPGTGKEYFYSVQLLGNSLIYENDIMIFGLRYSDSQRSDTYSSTLNWRVNLNRQFRINPRLRVDYREDKEDEDDRWLVRPFVRIDYRFKRWMKFELDYGYEWLEETFGGEAEKTTGYFFSIGYRAQF